MGKDANVTVDVNEAIEQGERILVELWKAITSASTACAVVVNNNTQFALKLRGGFQWQGKTHESADDIPAGESGGWLMHSQGFDGSFSAQTWKLDTKSSASSTFLTVGQLVYMTGAQSRYTALLDGTNRYGAGTTADKDKMMALLNEGRSASWRGDATLLGGEQGTGVDVEIRVDITSHQGISNATNFMITLNQEQ